MKIIRWTILAVIVGALVFGAYQGFLLNKSLSELQRQADIQAETLEHSDISLTNLAPVIAPGLSKVKFHQYRKDAVLCPGAPGEWDESGIGELSIVRKDSNYYLYYDGWNASGVHQIGLATSTDLINWIKEPTNPVLTIGGAGAWDEDCVEDMTVIYFPQTSECMMWYEGKGGGKSQVGYAISNDGISWAKYSGNPVVPSGLTDEFDHAGCCDPAVIVYRGTYYMVYGAVSEVLVGRVGLAISQDGINWIKEGEVLPYGKKIGGWTAESMEVTDLYHFGAHVLALVGGYSSGSWTISGRIGFLLTRDFVNWIDFTWNPLGVIGNTPGEVLIFDYDEDIIYGLDWGGARGTSLYVSPRKEGSLVPIEMLALASLAGGATSTLADCLEVDLDQISKLAITVECTYNAAATQGMRVHIRSSTDGISFDTADLYTFDNDLVPGGVGRKTITIEPDVRFLKVLVENPDAKPITNVKVTATIGS